MKTWLLRSILVLLGAGFGYWLAFTLHFFVDIVPHGGMW